MAEWIRWIWRGGKIVDVDKNKQKADEEARAFNLDAIQYHMANQGRAWLYRRLFNSMSQKSVTFCSSDKIGYSLDQEDDSFELVKIDYSIREHSGIENFYTMFFDKNLYLEDPNNFFPYDIPDETQIKMIPPEAMINSIYVYKDTTSLLNEDAEEEEEGSKCILEIDIQKYYGPLKDCHQFRHGLFDLRIALIQELSDDRNKEKWFECSLFTPFSPIFVINTLNMDAGASRIILPLSESKNWRPDILFVKK